MNKDKAEMEEKKETLTAFSDKVHAIMSDYNISGIILSATYGEEKGESNLYIKDVTGCHVLKLANELFRVFLTCKNDIRLAIIKQMLEVYLELDLCHEESEPRIHDEAMH